MIRTAADFSDRAIANVLPATALPKQARSNRDPAAQIDVTRVALSEEAKAIQALPRELVTEHTRALDALFLELRTHELNLDAVHEAHSAGNPKNLYAEVRDQNGRVVAQIYNGGGTVFPDDASPAALNAVGAHDPHFDSAVDLSAWRTEQIAAATGGSVVLASTAITDPDQLTVLQVVRQAVLEASLVPIADTRQKIQERQAAWKALWRTDSEVQEAPREDVRIDEASAADQARFSDPSAVSAPRPTERLPAPAAPVVEAVRGLVDVVNSARAHAYDLADTEFHERMRSRFGDAAFESWFASAKEKAALTMSILESATLQFQSEHEVSGPLLVEDANGHATLGEFTVRNVGEGSSLSWNSISLLLSIFKGEKHAEGRSLTGVELRSPGDRFNIKV